MRRRKLVVAAVALVAFGAVAGAAVVVGAGAWVWHREQPTPVEYSVIRGDTLFKIAQAHGVSVDELRGWNDIDGDLIEVDQVLVVWPGLVEAPPTRGAGGRRSRHPTGEAPTSSRGLSLPAELPCLLGPDEADLTGEEQMVGSRGLSRGQITTAMGPFLPIALQCTPEGTTPSGRMLTEIRVACTGRVAEVRVLDHGEFPEDMVQCIADVLGYVAFPAHDLPDGETFQYPLTISW